MLDVVRLSNAEKCVMKNCQDYREYCKLKYLELFAKFCETELKRGTIESLTEKKKDEIQRAAQKEAIKETFKTALDIYTPVVDAAQLWNAVYVAHVMRKANISGKTKGTTLNDEIDIIKSVISADQSWKKSSGHAFESFISETANPSLARYGIRLLLQRELTQLIEQSQIHNVNDDLEWIKQKVNDDVFDLYAIFSWQNHNHVFGCLQSKTSIRDRVTRDREPSLEAMTRSFLSIAVTLDGAFLKLPKFQEM